MTKTLTTFVFGLLALFAVSPISAITVNWGPVTAINSNLDIVNAENVIEAVNFAPTSQPLTIDVDVNGTTVTFNRNSNSPGVFFHNDDFFVDNNPAPGMVSGDTESEFHQVLDSFGDNNNFSYSFTGLTGGETYLLQVFHSDDRGNRSVAWNINGESLAFNNNTTTFRSAFSVATVTLAPAETSITLQRTSAQLNAAVLSLVAAPVPEPTSIALWATFGLGLLGYGAHRRWRK